MATCNGEVVAFARAVVEEGQTWVKEVAGRDVAAAQAVLAGAVALGSAPTTGVIGRAHPVVGMVCDRFGHRSHEGLALYARLPDPLALLRALQPELSARLVSSPWRDQDGDLTISTYRTGYRLTYRHGEVTAIERVRALMYPVEQGGIGIPEDQLAGFLLGRRDPRLLADSVDDVLLGRNEELARTLFPPLRYDHLPLVV